MDVIEKLVRHIVERTYPDIPLAAIEAEKREVLDNIGTLIAGATAPGCRAIVDLVKESAGRQDATVMIYGGKVPAENAALANAVMSRALDFESCQTSAHAGASAVFTAFAISERIGLVSGKDFIASLVLALDLVTRIHLSAKIQQHGWDPALVCSIFGTTAVAGKLMGLDRTQMRDAFGIALDQAGGTRQGNYEGALTVRLNNGLAARQGVFSALLAQRGITGIREVMQGRFGYYHLFARNEYALETLTAGLGERYLNVGINFKMYPSCYATHCVTEAVIRLACEHAIVPDDVEEIVIGLPRGAAEHFCVRPFSMEGVPQVRAQFSNQYVAANAVLRRRSLKEHFTDEFIRDPKVQDLVKRVKQVEVLEPPRGMGLPAQVEILMKGGEVYSTKVEAPKGSPEYPPTKEEIVEKFRGNVVYSANTAQPFPIHRGDELVSLVDHIEELDDVGRIIEVLTPPFSDGL